MAIPRPSLRFLQVVATNDVREEWPLVLVDRYRHPWSVGRLEGTNVLSLDRSVHLPEGWIGNL
jgi:hypothetical protein